MGETSSSGAWTQWSSAPYTPPTDVSTYLYSAPDPDSSSHSIGLLLMVDRNGALTGIVWYKVGQPTDGWVWQPANSPVSGLTWTYVGTSASPTTISATSNWYYIAQP